MKINRYNEGQKRGLFEMLKSQKNQMTKNEKAILSELRDYFAEDETSPCGTQFKRVGNLAKEHIIDTFGEDYRERWTKVRENNKGSFFYSSYQGKRIYID